MSKKTVIKIAAIALAVVLLSVAAVIVIKNVGTTVVTLAQGKALPGDTLQIPLKIDKNHGIWGGQIIINYDADNLSFVSCTNGEVFDECEVNDNSGTLVVLVTQTKLKDTKIDGLIATLSFKAKVSADKAEYKLAFDSETNFCNSEQELVDAKLENGKITVK